MGTKGQLPPGAAGEGAQNSFAKNILWLTITKVAMIKFADWAKTSLSQQTYICYFGCELKALGTPLNRMLLSAPYTPKKEIGEGAHFRAPRTLVAPLLRSADWPHDTKKSQDVVDVEHECGCTTGNIFRSRRQWDVSYSSTGLQVETIRTYTTCGGCGPPNAAKPRVSL